MMNSVNLIGRLTADPQTKQYDERDEPNMVTDFCLAIDRAAAAGTDLIPVTTSDVLAATCPDVIREGHVVGVSGRLHHSEWTTPDNERRARLEVIASRVDFWPGPKGRPRTAGHRRTPLPGWAWSGTVGPASWASEGRPSGR